MKYFILILINFSILNAQGISTAVSYEKQSFDVLEYSAEIDLTNDIPNFIEGTNHIKFTWTAGNERIFYFHLQDLTIDSVLYNGNKINFSKHYITDPVNYYYRIEPNDQQDTVILSIFYKGEMTSEGGNFDWGGVHFEKNILYALGVGFYNEYVSTTRHWLPCYDHPSDKAVSKINFITDQNKTVASNGTLIRDTLINEKRHLLYHNKDQIATYLLTFAEGNYTRIEDQYEEIPIEVFTKPEDLEDSKIAYANIPKMIECYENYFGDYPFSKVGYVNTGKGAMEHQTMISIPAFLVAEAAMNKDSNHTTIAHELSHQWFGDKVTPLDFRHAWINEAIATFSESLYLEYLNGEEDYIREMRINWGRYKNAVIKNEGDLPLYDFQKVEGTSNYPETIYKKGALVMQMLRYQIGDDAFFKGLRKTLENENYTTGSLKNSFETNADLDTFFDQWILNNGFPKINIEVSEDVITEGPNAYTAIMFRVFQDTSNQNKTYKDVIFNINVILGNSDQKNFTVELDQEAEEFKFRFEDDFEDITYLRANAGPDLISLVDVESINLVTSVTENKPDNFIIYPNPAYEQIRIKNAEGFDYEIYNQTGKMIKGGTYHNSIKIGRLESGTYFIKLSGTDQLNILKFNIIR